MAHDEASLHEAGSAPTLRGLLRSAAIGRGRAIGEGLLVSGLLTAVAFIFRTDFGFRAGPRTWQPWMGWYDQREYLRMARAIGDFALSRHTFMYGWGWPVLAAPFAHRFANPFYFVNIALWIAWSVISYRGLVRIFGRAVAILALALPVATLPLAEYVLFVPWSNAATFVSLAMLLALLWADAEPTPLRTGLAGLALGWTFSARYLDAILAVPLALPLLRRVLKARISGRRKLATIAAGLAALSLFVGPTLYLHRRLLGSVWTTPYKFHRLPNGGSDQDASTHDLRRSPLNLYQTWIDTRGAGAESLGRKAIAPLLPVLYLLPLGLAVCLLAQPVRQALVVPLLVFVLWNLFYGSYYLAASTLPFNAYRYVAGWFPLLTAISLQPLAFALGRVRARLESRRRANHPGPPRPAEAAR